MPSALVGKLMLSVNDVSRYMVSSVFSPMEYSKRAGDLAIVLTNQGSLLMSPVYKAALPWPSNTTGRDVSGTGFNMSTF